MASASTSWMPAQGKFQVNIGSSLNRALKARKQGGTPPATNPRRNLPDRDFYSFRYNFKPPSIDATKPGTVEIKKGRDKEKSQVALELSSQAGEANIYAGNETQAKEWDCVLVYDDETGAYTLEKVDSFVSLTFERKRTAAKPHSPVPSSPTDKDAEGEDDDDLEKELLGLTEDIPLAEKVKPKQQQQQQRPQPATRPPPQKKEVKEPERRISPVPEAKLPPKPQPAKPARQTNVQPKPRAPPPTANMGQPPASASVPIPTPASKPKAAQTKKRKEPELTAPSDPEVEVLSFGQPAKRAKAEATSKALTPPPAPSFALPGTSSSGFFQPPPPPKTQKPSVPAVPPTTAATEDSDKEDWEEVANAETDLEPESEPVPRALSYHSDEGDVGGGDAYGDADDGNGEDEGLFGDEDPDMEDELAKQLNEELDGDFLEVAMTEAPPSDVQPLSWGQLAEAQGVTADYDSDEYSSSEDSDED
ncbi:hypothetical protein AGABI2DRAFT_191595 [Agaricus bisporus var. bisporus H97]|uniref:hypothetical protein n=1 Tax=Agaricus bisporus var. bisporus (strain H97 / ATCC MYA-4626 / FGSC 10389) TaxID=936046 RepID=UPI00029F5FC8|nr:hypothetical protein AGABI2DRAFT_191595 [Agaricus bisporus var. bisporus H97]EKV47868.1 hypothetical protein AGABI2DRAFT_191595 [Agaricus bisporus var. bisporus H97]